MIFHNENCKHFDFDTNKCNKKKLKLLGLLRKYCRLIIGKKCKYQKKKY
jgi:hypothetical protein